MIRPVTARPKQFLAGLLLLASVFVLVRGPLHAVTFSLPVSNDDAILLLMARHILKGELATILWNQPYNGALDAYLLAPGLALGPHHLVFRLYELLCAALLVSLDHNGDNSLCYKTPDGWSGPPATNGAQKSGFVNLVDDKVIS